MDDSNRLNNKRTRGLTPAATAVGGVPPLASSSCSSSAVAASRTSSMSAAGIPNNSSFNAATDVDAKGGLDIKGMPPRVANVAYPATSK